MPSTYRLLLFTCLLVSTAASAQLQAKRTTQPVLKKIIDINVAVADAQYKLLSGNLPPAKFPKTFYPDKNEYGFSNSGCWCSGFYPGTLLYLYEQSHDDGLKNEVFRMLDLLKKEQFNTGTHDPGFMMYCSFGNAYRIFYVPAYKEVLLNSAKSLSTRFNPKTGGIKSWDAKTPGDFLVIIDNMMDLEPPFLPAKSEVDVPLTYADYYYVEAMTRYKALGQ